ncbi:MAG: hypothetical protein HXX13_11100 [Bacteroidetes bacterium]|nr:hypothetical protein [Bacteroidota bacterium]
MDKMLNNPMCPDENELAKFIEGNLTGHRLTRIKEHLDSCSLCNDMVKLAMEFDVVIEEQNNLLMEDPASQKIAALSKRNLCVLHAEMYILQLFKFKVDLITLLELSDKYGWLSKGGVQFKNIGKLLEFFGFKVERKTNALPKDINEAIEQGYKIIVGVDKGELFLHSKLERIYEIIEDWIEKRPDHALIVTGVQMKADSADSVSVINFENEQPVNYIIPFSQFMDAWKDSDNYMVMIREGTI